ncbi:hypothetical protein OC25_00150 [Pedobacter kyungheensis]|uniref:Uncharacterized protein n=1 Tax=Pedobacter kyungheensis TaxID=1069985 RepID=A0A0C1FV64_9SPHI|nr:hypothetical protein [Pedobacter kyungheensis]KIA96872.1 hypothetical protein OC25_00150 [Pedobacter kyungheensis]
MSLHAAGSFHDPHDLSLHTAGSFHDPHDLSLHTAGSFHDPHDLMLHTAGSFPLKLGFFSFNHRKLRFLTAEGTKGMRKVRNLTTAPVI